jgi:hypothetical protein
MTKLWGLGITFLLLCLAACGNSQAQGETDWLKPGKCKNLWRHARLAGRCFGLSHYKEFVPHLKNLVISTSEECRALCCNLGDKCVSWQFVTRSKDLNYKECRLTDKILRLGNEPTGTPEWCDPHPPSKWNGNKLLSKANGVCQWGEQLPGQCFGLGDEHRDSRSKPLNTTSCAQACCNDPQCEIWQEVPGRGCYFNKAEGIWCEIEPELYEGARKCISGFCDGREKEILAVS